MTRLVRSAAAYALALGLGACGSATTNASTEATDAGSTSERVTPDAMYSNVSALRDAAISTGYHCEHWATRQVSNASQSGRCSPGDGFAIFGSRKDTLSALHIAIKLDGDFAHAGVTPSYLVGPNWMISNFDQHPLERLRKELGGQIRHVKGG